MKLKLSWNFPPLWLFSIVLEMLGRVPGEKSLQQSYPAVSHVDYNTNLPGKILVLVLQWHGGDQGTKH